MGEDGTRRGNELRAGSLDDAYLVSYYGTTGCSCVCCYLWCVQSAMVLLQTNDADYLRRRHCRICTQRLLFLCLWLLVMVHLARVELHCDCSLRSRSPPWRLFECEDRVDEVKGLRWEGCLGRLLACWLGLSDEV